MLRNLLLLGGAVGAISAASGATFSISPANVPYNSTNTIILAVGSVANGQTVLIEEFADDNANGLVDPAEQLLMRLVVGDGERSTLPPSTAFNRAGDDDGATNGAITKVLRLGALPERVRVAGKFVFRLSAADASFAPVVRPFTMENGNHHQAVTGTVIAGATPLPFAFVALLGGGEDGSELVAGAVSDSNGNFTVCAPVGNYNLLALKAGYVFDFGSAPEVSLSAGTTNSQNVTVLAATRTISGSVIDSVTANGIGGLQMFAQSEQGFAALAFTDADGSFSIPVGEDMWEIEVSDYSAALVGCGRSAGHADTTSGSATGVTIALSRALGRTQFVFFFPWGSFNGGTNGAINYPTRLDYYFVNYNVDDENAPTNVFFSGPPGSGLSNTPSENSNGGSGGNSVSYTSHSSSVPAYPPGGSYIVSYQGYPQTFVLPDPDAANRQVMLVPRAIVDSSGQLQEIRWVYRSPAGDLISPPAFMQSIEVRVDGNSGQLYNGDSSPGVSSHVLSSPVPWADVGSVQMVYEDDLGSQYVAFWSRHTQPLQIQSHTLPNATVGSQCDYLFVASGGRAPYSWTMLSGNLPGGVNFNAGTGALAGIPQANGTWNFRLRVSDDMAAATEKEFSLLVSGGNAAPPRLEIRPTGNPGEFGLRLVGNVGRSYSLEYSTALPNWSPLMTTNLTSASIDLVDRAATNQLRFYRVTLIP